MALKIDRPASAERSGSPSTRVKIDEEYCEATGVCAQVCPEDVFAHDNGRTTVVDMAACTNCWICVDNCASGAIELD